MSKLYICAHTAKLGSKSIIDALVADGAISDWCYSMRGTFFFRSKLSAQELAARFKAHFGMQRHFFTDITESSKWGALPKQHWEMLLQKKK